MKRIISRYDVVLALVAVVIFIAFGFVIDGFFSEMATRAWIFPFIQLGIVAMGQSLVMGSGNWDLSVGSTFGFAQVVLSTIVLLGYNVGLGLALCLVSGCLIGLLNGLLVTRWKIPSFCATLGMLATVRGLAILIQNHTLDISGSVSFPVPEALSSFSDGHTPVWVPPSFFLFAILAIGVFLVLRYTNIGISLLATGGSDSCARAAGLRVDKIKTIAFIMSGLTAAIAAIIYCTGLGVASPLEGGGYELQSIIAVILGGSAMTGGRVSVLGTVAACFILTAVVIATSFMGLSQVWTNLIGGLLIVGSISVYGVTNRVRNLRSKPGCAVTA